MNIATVYQIVEAVLDTYKDVLFSDGDDSNFDLDIEFDKATEDLEEAKETIRKSHEAAEKLWGIFSENMDADLVTRLGGGNE
jgi:tRNA splicing ligase